MQFTLYSPIGFEPYDYRNPDYPGIGGSETAVREYAWRLAKRGHDVQVYCPIPSDTVSPWRNSRWSHLNDTDYTREGIWILSRCPDHLDHFSMDHPGQHLWIVCQDTDYMGVWNEERLQKIDRIICLCETHCLATQRKYPSAAQKVCLGFNGLRTDLIEDIESEGTYERNPCRIIFASSPDRGLLALLKIFKRCREWEPKMELWIGYGFDNIQKWIDSDIVPYELRRHTLAIQKELDQPGVTMLGRIGQPELYRRRLQCGMAVHPTLFTETGFISGIEEMALGCVPVLCPTWAAAEYVQHGVWIEGDPSDPLVESRFVGEICSLARSPEVQKRMRLEMMPWARARFTWEWMVDLIEQWSEIDANAILPVLSDINQTVVAI